MNPPKLSRRDFLQAGLGALAGAALPASLGQLSLLRGGLPTAATVPGNQAAALPNTSNVVYIFADQLRACSVGCYGNSEIDTHHIDELASQGVRFANAISTSPLCTPHRGCLMTGRYPTTTGMKDNSLKLPANERCLAEVFSENGYQTAYFGKWHLNGVTPAPIEDPGWVAPEERQGFQNWLGFNYAHLYYGGHYYLDTDPVMQTIPEGIYEPDFQTEEVIRFITENQTEKFCLLLSIGTPHQASQGTYDLPPGGDYSYPYDPASLTLRPNVDCPDLDTVRQEYADYYGITSNLDWNVERIMQTLDSLGLTENTIVVVTSDHGDLLYSHYGEYYGSRAKARVEAESLDVPFILRYPTAVIPSVINDVFTSVDILPTLLGLCGLSIPDGVMGRNFAPLLTKGEPPADPPYGPAPSTESALAGMWNDKDWVAVRTPQYTFQCRSSSLTPLKLYDNSLDPYQLSNRIDDPQYDSARNDLYEQLIAWLDYIKIHQSYLPLISR